MRIEKHVPTGILKPFIKTFMFIESESGMENNILPDTSLTIAFRLRGLVTYEEQGIKKELPLSAVSGLRKSPRLLCYSHRTTTLLIVFKEGGASAFFKEPLHELFGSSLSLDMFTGIGKLKEVEERLAEAPNNVLKIFVIEQFLLSKLKEPKPDLLILDAIRKIQSVNGDIRIKNLANGLHISQDPFEKRFRRVTGTSPKYFSSIVRLRNIIENHSNTENFTEAGYIAGYFDQAHFIKSFKTFTGQTPQDFFRIGRYW